MENNTVLPFIGLMRKAGALALGGENAYDAVRTHKARLLVLTKDSGPNTANATKNIAGQFEVPLLVLPCTKAELGSAVGLKECAALAVTNTGFALALCQKCERSSESQLLEQRQQREHKRKQKKLDRTAAKSAGTDTRKGGK